MTSKLNLKSSLLIAIVYITLWEVLSRVVLQNDSLFPSLVQIVQALTTQIQTSEFWNLFLLPSLSRFFTAALIGIPLGLVTGLTCARWEFLNRLLGPFFAFSYPLPKVVLFPFLILIFGIGFWSKVLLICLGIFYLVHINVYIGALRVLQSDYSAVARVYRFTKWNWWYHFYLKGCVPSLLVGMKAGLIYGLTLIIVGEMSMTQDGIGFYIWSAWDQFRIVDLYVGTVIVGIWGFFIYYCIEHFEKKILTYY